VILHLNNRGNQILAGAVFDGVFPPSLQLSLGQGPAAELQVSGVIGSSYQIEYSADFHARTTTGTLVLTNIPYLWLDPDPVQERRFTGLCFCPSPP